MDWKAKDLLLDLEQEITNRDNEITDLSRKVGTLEADVLRLADQLEDRDEEIARLEGEIEYLNKTLAETILIKGTAK